MSNLTGSIKRVDVFGIAFDVTADAEPNLKPTTEKEKTATSGAPLIKATKMVGMIEAITLSVTPAQQESLDNDASSNKKGSIALTTANGDTYRDEGTIEIADFSLAAGTCDLTLIPEKKFVLI